jgi:hypothetical protein
MPTAKSKSSVLSSYAKPELVGYVSGDRKARWEKARDAAKAVLDLPGFGYALNLTNPASAADGTANYMNASLARNGGEKEILIGRYFINAKQEGGGRQGLFNGPNGYHNLTGIKQTTLLLLIPIEIPVSMPLSFMKVLHGNHVRQMWPLKIRQIKFRPGSIYCQMVRLFLV